VQAVPPHRLPRLFGIKTAVSGIIVLSIEGHPVNGLYSSIFTKSCFVYDTNFLAPGSEVAGVVLASVNPASE
jgi:hypothetical protein